MDPPTHSPSPAYSPLPLSSETTLAHNTGHRRGRPSGPLFVRQWSNVTVTLLDQDHTAQEPSYCRNSMVRGSVDFLKNDRLLAVEMKLYGRQDLISSHGGSRSTVLVSEKFLLWDHESSPSQQCPSSVPFTFRFPATFSGEERRHYLPPSYHATFSGQPALIVKCSYLLTIRVSKARFYGWKSHDSYPIVVKYVHESRPDRPCLARLPFLLSVKESPQEWTQTTSQVAKPGEIDARPVSCHFAIPSAQTFGLRDVIPFHVQIDGPLALLESILPPSSAAASSADYASDRIRVYLLRQVSAETDRQRIVRNVLVGTAHMRALSPPAYSPDILRYGKSSCTLEWEGEVQCDENINDIGFNTEHLAVKDFIVVSLKPPKKGPLPAHQLSHPVRFVTDSWIDHTTHPEDR